MTDKQIIVDGVDVSGCRAFNNPNYPNKCGITGQDCLGKKCPEMLNQVLEILKTKEQECEELEKELRQKKMTIMMNNDHYLEVDQENKKLKQTLTEIKEIAEEAGNTQYLTFPDFNLKQNVKMLMGQFNGYLQQILQKISEVEDEHNG